MCLAGTSTTSPSGNFRPSLMMVFRSEPSGFAVNTRPAPRSRKNSRPDLVDLFDPVYPFVATVRLLLNAYLQPGSPSDLFHSSQAAPLTAPSTAALTGGEA